MALYKGKIISIEALGQLGPVIYKEDLETGITTFTIKRWVKEGKPIPKEYVTIKYYGSG